MENIDFEWPGGGHCIRCEKPRSAGAEAAAAHSRQVMAGNPRVEEVRPVDHDTARDRFVNCHNAEQAVLDADVRAQIVERL